MSEPLWTRPPHVISKHSNSSLWLASSTRKIPRRSAVIFTVALRSVGQSEREREGGGGEREREWKKHRKIDRKKESEEERKKESEEERKKERQAERQTDR